jgi:serine/threonine protein kinase/class 3 adenylate cyclase
MTMANLSTLATPAHRLAALVFTDIVNSTLLKTRLRGSYFKLLERHNDLFEAGIRETPFADIIKHTGDGYFASFATASDAVHFALLFQARMRLEPWSPEKIDCRLGVHIGEVMFMDMAGRKDIVGLSADIAARLMSLAVGGQILLTETAFNDARQYVNCSPAILGKTPPLRWMAHGRYLFQGADDPLEVYEVGVDNFFPLQRPGDSQKVKRVVPHDQESTLGWRPAAALPVPGRAGWQLVRKLGEGGFGEVWLGEHLKLKELRVFKFCFDAERLRGLKREYMLFRLLRESLGRRPDIAALYEVKLDEPPFFLESEYSEGGNLLEWAERHGGIQTLDLKSRIEFLAKVADALAAAHSVGVIHKDIKPSNILIHQAPDGDIEPRLADFGIGALSDRSRLKANNVTDAGFTEIASGASSNSLGTRMYSPPETMRDAPFTTLGDIYALGVILYQLVVGDLLRPLAHGWERDIPDPIMRQDIAAIVEGDPQRRIALASEVAHLLRTQDARRDQIKKAELEVAQRQRRRKMRRVWAVAASVVIFILLLGIAAEELHIHNTNRQRDRAIANTNALRAEQDRTMRATQFLLGVIKEADPANSADGNPTAEKLIDDASGGLDSAFSMDSDISAQVQTCFADALKNFSDARAIPHYAAAEQIYARLHGNMDRRTLKARFGQGYVLVVTGKYSDAQKILQDVFDKQMKVSGPDDRDTLETELLYAAAVNGVKGPAESESKFRDALDRRRKNFSENDKDTIQSISAYASVERDLGKLDYAEKLAKQALDWRAANFGPENFGTLPSLQTYGLILVDLNRANEAVPLLKKLVDRREQLDPSKTRQSTLRAYSAYADALCANGNFTDADVYYVKAREGFFARDKSIEPKPKDALTAELGYAELLNAQGHADKAQPLARELFDTFSAAASVYGPRLTLRSELALATSMDKLHDPAATARYKDAADKAAQTFGLDNAISRQYQQKYEAFASQQKAAPATVKLP